MKARCFILYVSLIENVRAQFKYTEVRRLFGVSNFMQLEKTTKINGPACKCAKNLHVIISITIYSPDRNKLRYNLFGQGKRIGKSKGYGWEAAVVREGLQIAER